jgi:Flp pilus assembly pilin Flp
MGCFLSYSIGGRDMFGKFWRDEGGAVLSVELILLLVILVFGLVVGMTALRDAIDFKFVTMAEAVNRIDPSYAVAGIAYHGPSGGAGTLGSYGAVAAKWGFDDSALTGVGTAFGSPTSFASVLTGGSVTLSGGRP